MTAVRRKRRIAADEAHSWARNLRLRNPYAKLVLAMLSLYVNGEGACFVSITQLADDCEFAAETVRRRLLWLESIGAIVRMPQWRDDLGRLNSEGRGKRTTDEIRLMFDADQDQIEAAASGKIEAGEENSPSEPVEFSHPSGRVANPVVEGTAALSVSTPAPHLAPHLAPHQPSNSGGGLISEPEPEPEQEDSPQPPKNGGSEIVADDGWKEFEDDWQEPITRPSLARQVWAAFTASERALARKAARGYVAWRKGQRKPPNALGAHLFLKERDAWERFAALAPAEHPVKTVSIFEAEDAPSWRARRVISAIADVAMPKAIASPEGRGWRFGQALDPAKLALAQFADDDPEKWTFVAAGTQPCGAWRQFVGVEPRQITVGFKQQEIRPGHVVDDWPIKEFGLRVPCLWPPRKDGSFSTAGPPEPEG